MRDFTLCRNPPWGGVCDQVGQHLDFLNKSGLFEQFSWGICLRHMSPWSVGTRDAQNAKRVGLYTLCSRLDTRRLNVYESDKIIYNTVILHSKITKVTPERPQIAPDQ